jgi:hypothetical protein
MKRYLDINTIGLCFKLMTKLSTKQMFSFSLYILGQRINYSSLRTRTHGIYLETLFYTLGLGKVVSHVMVPFAFLHRYGNLTILKFSFKWVKVMLPYTGGGRAACSGGWGQSGDS